MFISASSKMSVKLTFLILMLHWFNLMDSERLSVDLEKSDVKILLRALRKSLKKAEIPKKCYVFKEHLPQNYSDAYGMQDRLLPTSDHFIGYISKCPFWGHYSDDTQFWVRSNPGKHPPHMLTCPGLHSHSDCWIVRRRELSTPKLCFQPSPCSDLKTVLVYRSWDANFFNGNSN